ncbi:Major Facilitator Superfamily protein [Actinomadura madurae]|uniref:Major Facilitator Superfamily protein n=1 Tax=Actinomadura madurae TaxID=1993 RepID=A0A1I5NB54_9ACTN|nr:MFS transporter [Actinomadura madurae]SFP18917.1 Major Facilitator Superfamily protein [Actinomadura madurae]
MWVVAVLAATAAYLARRFGLRETGGDTAPRADRVLAPVLLIAALAVALAQTIVVGVLAGFARELGTDATGATWLLTSFMLASAVATPIAGRLGDHYGHRRIIIAGLVLLILGSVIAAISTTNGWYGGILAGRIVQGLAGGVFPCAFGLARRLVPAARLPGLIVALSAMFGVGGAFGLVAAGPLVDLAGLTAVFWLVGGLAVLALAGTFLFPEPRAPRVARQAVDVRGAVLLAATLVALLLAVSQGRGWGWSSPRILGLATATITFASLFLIAERRATAPLIAPQLLVGRRLLALNVATVVIAVGMFAAVTLLPLFAQTPAELGYGFGYSASRTGLLIAPIGLFMVIAAPMAPHLTRRIGARGVFQVGAVLATAGLLGLAYFHDEPATVAGSGAVLGLAYGFAFGSLGSLVIAATPPEHTGAATGINTILRTIGGAMGSVIAVAIVAASTSDGTTPPTESGYTTAFTVSALIALAAAIIAAAVPSSQRTTTRDKPEPRNLDTPVRESGSEAGPS